MTDELDEYIAKAVRDPAFARSFNRAGRDTAIYISRDLAWFRVLGYGLWVKWGAGRDLFSTRKNAHYAGRFRWKGLTP